MIFNLSIKALTSGKMGSGMFTRLIALGHCLGFARGVRGIKLKFFRTRIGRILQHENLFLCSSLDCGNEDDLAI